MQLTAQNGMVIWLLGLSGSGKSTIASLLEEKLIEKGYFAMRLDGDELRSGLNSDLSFTAEDRTENLRRAAEMAKFLVRKNIITICSFITPAHMHRQNNRILLGHKYFEVYLECPVSICEERDAKGLYQLARKHEIENFTGVTSVFQQPAKSDLVLHTSAQTAQESAQKLFESILPLIRKQP